MLLFFGAFFFSFFWYPFGIPSGIPSNNIALERNCFSENSYFVEFFANVNERFILRVLRLQDQLSALRVVEHTLQCCFVSDYYCRDLSVFYHRLRTDKNNVTIKNAGACHTVAGTLQAKVRLDVCTGFNVTFSFFIAEYRFSAGNRAEKRQPLHAYGRHILY